MTALRVVEDTRGWDALESAAVSLKPDGAPVHYGPGHLPGVHGLAGLSAYRIPQHWWLMTFGLSDLYATTPKPASAHLSGYGIELTMLVPRRHEEQPPRWALQLLAGLSGHVRATNTGYRVGQVVDTGSLTGSPTSRLNAVAFDSDPLLMGGLSTANGHVNLLRVVGITAGEFALAKRTSVMAMLNRSPIGQTLLTDPNR